MNAPTWEEVLDKHFKAFSEGCWKVFNLYCEEMNKYGHENKIDFSKWREYVIHDIQERHKLESSKKL